MILKYENHLFNNFTVFERVTFVAPFKPSVTYEDEACFIYSLSGQGRLYGGLEKDCITEGESILMKCGSFLNHWQSSEEGKACEIIAIHVTHSIISKIYNNRLPDYLISKDNKSNRIFEKVAQKEVIDEYIKGLILYFDHPELINEELIKLKLKELILLLYNINYGFIREMLSTLFDPVELEFKSIIEAHLFEELDIKDYAALTNTSLSTFKRKFKRMYEQTPANFILDKRLHRAAELLKNTSLRITEVCFESGFKDLSIFSRSFAKKYGLSPSSYRDSI